MKNNIKFIYIFIGIIVLSIMTIGTTYAYWTATTKSMSEDVKTNSTIYSISMDIEPLYSDFSIIPMDDEDALKGLSKKCKDKYDRGACSAYTIYVYDYNEDLDYVSGYMDITTNNMQNLSYMMFRLSDTYEEDKCVQIEELNEIYCVAREASSMGEGKELSLGDAYDVSGMTSTKFILLMWLTNLDVGQNDIDIGNFEAIVTMQAGNGGEIKGSIASAIKIDNTGNGDNTDNDNTDDNTDTDNDDINDSDDSDIVGGDSQ